jgi:hypothetical protein
MVGPGEVDEELEPEIKEECEAKYGEIASVSKILIRDEELEAEIKECEESTERLHR